MVYHYITPEIARAFQVVNAEKASVMLAELNHWLADNRNPRSKGVQAGKRIGVGIYYFESEVEDKKSEIQKTD